MSRIDAETQELHLQVAYVGQPLAGRGSNLRFIRKAARAASVEPLEQDGATLRLCFTPVTKDRLGRSVRFHLCCGPETVLDHADGIVFVIDSQQGRMWANVAVARALRQRAALGKLDLSRVPLLLQFNKRDLLDAVPLEELLETFNPQGTLPHVEADASTGMGVFETLKLVTERVLGRYEQDVKPA